MTRRRKKREIAKMSDMERAIARGAIPADLSKQAPNNSYGPPLYYEAMEFACRDCGLKEVWTAEQQQWYYEEAKGPIYATATRCRDCREKFRADKEIQRQQSEDAERRRLGGES